MTIKRRTQTILAISAAAFALVACGQQEQSTAGQKLDGAIEQTTQAAITTQQEIKEAATDMKLEGEKAAEAVSSSATDLTITAKVKAALAADDQLSAIGINVDTENAVVTMQGPAPDQAASDRATVLVKAIDGVSSVNNLLTIAGNS
jgi:hyperosmotically inducible periplasmic protein